LIIDNYTDAGETLIMAGRMACRVAPWCDLKHGRHLWRPTILNVNHVGVWHRV